MHNTEANVSHKYEHKTFPQFKVDLHTHTPIPEALYKGWPAWGQRVKRKLHTHTPIPKALYKGWPAWGQRVKRKLHTCIPIPEALYKGWPAWGQRVKRKLHTRTPIPEALYQGWPAWGQRVKRKLHTRTPIPEALYQGWPAGWRGNCTLTPPSPRRYIKVDLQGEEEAAHSHPHPRGTISRLTCMGPKGEEETAHSHPHPRGAISRLTCRVKRKLHTHTPIPEALYQGWPAGWRGSCTLTPPSPRRYIKVDLQGEEEAAHSHPHPRGAISRLTCRVKRKLHTHTPIPEALYQGWPAGWRGSCTLTPPSPRRYIKVDLQGEEEAAHSHPHPQGAISRLTCRVKRKLHTHSSWRWAWWRRSWRTCGRTCPPWPRGSRAPPGCAGRAGACQWGSSPSPSPGPPAAAASGTPSPSRCTAGPPSSSTRAPGNEHNPKNMQGVGQVLTTTTDV